MENDPYAKLGQISMTLAWHPAAGIDALKEGDVLGVTIGDTPVALYFTQGSYHATDNLCTHGQALLSDGYLEDCFIECPLHAGRFCVRTGNPEGPPVTKPVRVHPVKIEGGMIHVGLPV